VLLAAPLSRADDGVQYYLSLGDSLAQGYQPIGGPSSPLGFPGYNQGYPDQLLKLVRDRYEQLRLVDVEGAFSSTIRPSSMGFPLTSRASARGRGCVRRRRMGPTSTRTPTATPRSRRRSRTSCRDPQRGRRGR
jgi:hypothetical protein